MNRQHFKIATQCRDSCCDDRDESLTGCERFSGNILFQKGANQFGNSLLPFLINDAGWIFATLCRRIWLPLTPKAIDSFLFGVLAIDH